MSARVELRRDAGSLKPSWGPWIRKKQIARVFGAPVPGELVEVTDRTLETVAWGLMSPESNICVRLLAWGPERPDSDWLEQRLTAAFSAREAYAFEAQGTTGYREVNTEGDALPGLVIDRYGDDRVVQLTTASMVALERRIVAWLAPRTPGEVTVSIPEKSAAQEGVQARVESTGKDLCFTEGGLQFRAPGPPGQKTGAYFDQRENRRYVAELAARHGGPLLDVGCHIGGFAITAASRGVEVVAVDRSKPVLAHAERNAKANGVDVTWVEADMFARHDDAALDRSFATIVLDPPKMASKRSDVDRALAALRQTVARLLPKLAPGGHFVLCSCSHHIQHEQLDAAVIDHGRTLRRVKTLGAAVDHPVWPHHKEGEYLRVHVYQ